MSKTPDPRVSLATYGGAMAAQRFAAAEYARFYEVPPSESSERAKVWYARGQNFITGYAEARVGAELVRPAQPDEYAVLLPDAGTQVEIVWDGVATTVDGPSLAFVPPGASRVLVKRAGRLVLIFTSVSVDLCQRCVNAEAYAERHANIPPFVAWPDPPGGFKVRHYSLDVPDEPGRFGRIWRCTTLMVNFLPPQVGPRDPTRLSPHHHDTFEQGSFALDGRFTHHIRWPWTSDSTGWRQDEHTDCASPSLTVIPPPAIHTSRATGRELNQLIDIFSPPRLDFSLKENWVLNASDYPLLGS